MFCIEVKCMSDIGKQLGEQVRLLRQVRGLSQEQLAFKANLNTSFIGQIERGGKKPTISSLEKLVVALDTTFEELFSFRNGSVELKNSSVIDKMVFELKSRSVEEQETIYSIVKQILVFKDKG